MAIRDEPEVPEAVTVADATTPRTRRRQDQVPRLKLAELRAQVLNEGSKGLVLLNGGMAVALGTLFQAVLHLPAAGRFLPFILAGMGCAAVGALCASLIFLPRYFASFDVETSGETQLGIAQIALTVLSVSCFAASVVLVMIGGFRIL